MPAHLMVEIARDPDKFDSRIAEYQAAREVALEAKREAEAAKHEADEALALVRAESAALDKRRAEHEQVVADWNAMADQVSAALNTDRRRLAEAQEALNTERAAFDRTVRDFEAVRQKQNAEVARQSKANTELAQQIQESAAALGVRIAAVVERENKAAEVAEMLRAYLKE
jgi:hypothetical protein